MRQAFSYIVNLNVEKLTVVIDFPKLFDSYKHRRDEILQLVHHLDFMALCSENNSDGLQAKWNSTIVYKLKNLVEISEKGSHHDPHTILFDAREETIKDPDRMDFEESFGILFENSAPIKTPASSEESSSEADDTAILKTD